MQANGKKIESLQGLRALAFLGIFLIHTGCFIEWATLGVSIFFVLSGFLMAYSYWDKPLSLSFKSSCISAVRKIKKLYPLHIITMLVACIRPVIFIYQGRDLQALISLMKSVFYNVFLIQTFIPIVSENVSLNGVAWYLSASLVLYILFPYLMCLIRKIDNVVTLSMLAVVLVIVYYILGVFAYGKFGFDGKFFIWFTYCCPIYRVCDFFCGMVLAYIIKSGNECRLISNLRGMGINTIFEFLLLGITILFYLISRHTFSSVWVKAFFENWTIPLIILALLWLVVFLRKAGLISCFFSKKPWVFLGDYSPYLFLIHYNVTQFGKVFVSYFQIKLTLLQAWFLIIIEFVISFALSYLYKCIEDKVKRVNY